MSDNVDMSANVDMCYNAPSNDSIWSWAMGAELSMTIQPTMLLLLEYTKF